MSVFEPESIGARLTKARNEAGLTQEELGDLVGLSTRMVQHYEAGTVVPYKHLRKFAEVLNRDVSWLLHGDAQTPAIPPGLEAEVASNRVLLEAIASALGLDAQALLRAAALRSTTPDTASSGLEPPAEDAQAV